MANLIGSETWSNGKNTSQVYQATHNGAGNRLPYMAKSFISFTFGGKAIEDFGLIVVNSSDRMERQAYASFSDLTTNYDTLDGQLYWGSRFEPNQLELSLATDEITEQQIDNFREWFAPGKERELILSEHPNRAILARVASAPVLSFIPFEKKTSIKINNLNYDTSTTVYRGEVSLSFVMDEPHWYGILNYMPTYLNKQTLEELTVDSNNSNKVNSLQDKDMLKIMLEDGIPHQSILLGDNTSTFFLGGNILVTGKAVVGQAVVNEARIGVITGESEGLTVSPGSPNIPQYLFYSGTAPCKPIIQFSMALRFWGGNDQEENQYYIARPGNIIHNPSTEYSKFSIDNKTFLFTTPSILTGYNQAMTIFSNAEGSTAIEIFEQLREKVNERYSRAWAIACLNAENLGNAKITESNRDHLKDQLKTFVNPNALMTFRFDSETGEAKGKFSVKILTDTEESINTADYHTIEQNVGDMVLSDYLIIEGRNYLNSTGNIELSNCKKITSNTELKNVLVFFKNMYL